MPIVTIDAFVKFVQGQKVHQLRENRFPGIHDKPPPRMLIEEYGLMRTRISNRKKPFQPPNALVSMGYTMSQNKRWDTTAPHCNLKITRWPTSLIKMFWMVSEVWIWNLGSAANEALEAVAKNPINSPTMMTLLAFIFSPPLSKKRNDQKYPSITR
jgi:hypothetical protein